MCLFPRYVNPNSAAAKKGIKSFNCGCCPECMKKQASPWALRATYEAQNVPTCMVTLTYDQTIHDGFGRVIGERVDTRALCKRDAQLFIKRLRKHFSDRKLKYILTAERGSRTDRAHYHAILFNVQFDDLVFHKRSKRGNVIYRSKTLTDIWHNGICTVDSVNITAAVARYCTKYCAKDSRGADGTFMLFSHGIGEEGLLRDFNGKSYMLEGVEYPVPRLIWQRYIVDKYGDENPDCSPKYVNLRSDCENYDEFMHAKVCRDVYQRIRDDDSLYQSYRAYWQRKVEEREKFLPSEFDRILALPDDKYHYYKQKAILCYNWNKVHALRGGQIMPPPRSKSILDSIKSLGLSTYSSAHCEFVRFEIDRFYRFEKTDWQYVFECIIEDDIRNREHLAHDTCHYAPSDTIDVEQLEIF